MPAFIAPESKYGAIQALAKNEKTADERSSTVIFQHGREPVRDSGVSGARVLSVLTPSRSSHAQVLGLAVVVAEPAALGLWRRVAVSGYSRTF